MKIFTLIFKGFRKNPIYKKTVAKSRGSILTNKKYGNKLFSLNTGQSADFVLFVTRG